MILVRQFLSLTWISVAQTHTNCRAFELKGEKQIRVPYSLLSNINPSIHTTGASWDFLAEMENELEDTIMVCGDFNARSSSRANITPAGRDLLQRKRLVRPLYSCVNSNFHTPLGDVLFTPVSTATSICL